MGKKIKRMATSFLKRSVSQLFGQSRSDFSDDSLIEGSGDTSTSSRSSRKSSKSLIAASVPDKKVLRAVDKATERRKFGRSASEFLEMTEPLSSRKDLTPKIIRYAGLSPEGHETYEVCWEPVLMTLRDYRRGLHNFKEALPPKIVHDEKYGWMVHLTWRNVIMPAPGLDPKYITDFKVSQGEAEESADDTPSDASVITYDCSSYSSWPTNF